MTVYLLVIFHSVSNALLSYKSEAFELVDVIMASVVKDNALEFDTVH